jgi:lipid-A-disaccharide synthase
MRSQGQQQTVRAEDVAVMGVTEIIRHIPTIYARYRRLVRSIQRQRPDVAILIDFPDVNFRLAKHLHRAGVPVIWFVSPQLWAWKRGRLRWVQQRVSKMLVIFPFEERFYRDRGVDATFVGHPLAEQSPSTITREAFAQQHHLDPAKPWIALLPGSRWKEIRSNLPALHELAMSDLTSASASYTVADGPDITVPSHPAALTRYEFLLPVASTIQPAALQQYIAELNAEHLKYFGPEAASLRLTLITGPEAARDALTHARASVVASGTATVLAAIVGNPFLVVYRVSAFTMALAKRLVRYPAEFPSMPGPDGLQPVSMVNLIAGRRIVPELLQSRFAAANVATALTPLLQDGPERQAQIDALAHLRQRLAAPAFATTAIDRVAHAVLTALNPTPPPPHPNP